MELNDIANEMLWIALKPHLLQLWETGNALYIVLVNLFAFVVIALISLFSFMIVFSVSNGNSTCYFCYF